MSAKERSAQYSIYAILNAVSNTDTAKLVLNPGAVIQNNNIKQVSTSPDYLNGGGVFNSNGSIIMNGGTISGNMAHQHGGGVYSINYSIFIMNGGTISGNTATNNNGGGVFSNGIFTMNSGTISGNTATNNNGGGVFSDGTFTMNNGTISGNTAINNNGGGVYSNGTFTMNNGSIINNKANNNGGGGVYVDYNATFTMVDGTISNNTAYRGGGVFVSYNAAFTIRDGTVSGNEAEFGGGVQNNGTFNMSNSSISGNSSYSSGGGVYNWGGTFTMNSGTISDNNSTNHNGGGVYNQGPFTMNGGNFSGNAAVFGGGVYNVSTFTMNSGNFSHNMAFCDGGGVNNYGTFTMGGGEIFVNMASRFGGGVYNHKTFTLNGGNMLGNAAYNGGGVYNYKTFTMDGGTISGNRAIDALGGGVYCDSQGTFTMNNGIISGNAASYGGGVLNSGTFIMSNSSITGNAALFGGGVYNNDGTIIMNSGNISENSAKNNSGGGIYNQGSFTMYAGDILGNEAFSGGGVGNYGTFTMNSGNISGNTAHDYGGGVGNYGTFTMGGGAISNNTASSNGGGVYNNYIFTTSGGNISGNTAYIGGGVFNNDTFTMNSGTISGNRANNDGGGVFNNGTFNIQGASTITNNKKGMGVSAPLNNVYLSTNKPITVTGTLSGDIGVNMQTYGTAAVGSTSSAYTVTQNDTYCFKPDVNGYASHLDNANNLIKILLLPVMASLSAPASVTAGNKLLVAVPIVTDNGFTTDNHRFEIKKTGESFVTFDPQITVLDISYNGASLRYAADYINDTTKTIYSNEVPVNVTKAAPALLVEVNPSNSTTYGNVVTLTASFSGAYIPSGIIQFKVGGANLGGPVAISGGEAVYIYTPNASDTAYSYTAVYSGDDNNEPAISGAISYTVDKANQFELTVISDSTVTFGDTYFASVSGGTTSGAVTYEVIGGTGEGSFDGNVLTVTRAGTIIFSAKVTGNSNYNEVTTSPFYLTVDKADSTISINNDKTVTYYKNEVALTESDVTKFGSSGSVTFNYYSDIACTNEISAPINAGTYYVKSTVATDDNYNGETSEAAKITINPKPVNIIGVAVNDKVYDGQNTATINSSGIVSGVISGDTVNVKSGVCTFNSVNVGNSIAVTASDFGIEGASAGNYSLIGQPTAPSANITPATLLIMSPPFSI